MPFTKSKVFAALLFFGGGIIARAITGLNSTGVFFAGGAGACVAVALFDILFLEPRAKRRVNQSAKQTAQLKVELAEAQDSARNISVDKVLRHAFSLEQSGDWVSAISLYDQVAEANDNPDAEYARNSAATLRRRQAMAEVLFIADKFLQTNPIGREGSDIVLQVGAALPDLCYRCGRCEEVVP